MGVLGTEMRSGGIWRSGIGAGSVGHGRGESCHGGSRHGGKPLSELSADVKSFLLGA